VPRVRPAEPGDAEAIASIFNQGIEERAATFETRPQPADDWERRLDSGDELVLVAEETGRVVGWAAVGPYCDPHDHYSGIGEATLYVERDARRGGIGTALLEALAMAAERRGIYKLTGKIFTDNEPSMALVRACGFREVGAHLRHGRLDGAWKDVLVVERLLG
jgi:L-amino acid N-acyltransferase YncA